MKDSDLDEIIEQVERKVGYAASGWDFVDPRDLVRAVITSTQEADRADARRYRQLRVDLTNTKLIPWGARCPEDVDLYCDKRISEMAKEGE